MSTERMRCAGACAFARCVAVALVVATSAAGVPAAQAKVFLARDEALKLAFPDADKVEPRDVILTQEQHDHIEKLAKAPLETSLITMYVGSKDGKPQAYALFDSQTVRTFPETLLVVISPDGKVQATHVLAFHEPEEYLATPRWLATFNGKELGDDLQVGRGVSAITGSTLSTRAVTSAIRRSLAIWSVVIGGK